MKLWPAIAVEVGRLEIDLQIIWPELRLITVPVWFRLNSIKPKQGGVFFESAPAYNFHFEN